MPPRDIAGPSKGFTWQQLMEQRCGRLLELRARILRRGDAEAYHDIRVATRRLQELVGFLNPFLPQRRARRVWRRARKIRRSVSETRNTDVMRELADALARKLHPDQVRSLKKMCATCIPRPRRRAPRSLPEARRRIAALRRRFREPDHRGVIQRAERLLEERLARLEKARRTARTGSPYAMHRLRIAVKHYRYLLEILGPLGLLKAEDVLDKARRAQHTLGKLHDLDMLQEALSRNRSSKDVRRALAPERRRRLRESRQVLQALPIIEIRWRRAARSKP